MLPVKEADVRKWVKHWVSAKADDTDLIAEGGPERFARRLTLRIVFSAEATNIVVHLILGSLGLLPYPLSQALAVGSFVTAVVSAVVGYIVTLMIGGAICELAINRNEFQRLSSTDSLSGLLNRRAIFENIEHMRCWGSFLLFDIDHFKRVNDEYGHLAGDDVICAIAERFAACFLPNAGALIGRIGGEEFAVFLPDVNAPSGSRIADQARACIGSSEIWTRMGGISVTISGGVTNYDPEQAMDDAYMRCDRALYRAKSEGRNRICEGDSGVVGSGTPAAVKRPLQKNLSLSSAA